MKTKKNKQYNEVLEKKWENNRNERKESKVKTSASLVVRWLRIHCQCRGHGFSPWSRKIPHAEGQLSHASQLVSPCSRDGKPQLLKPAGSRACAPHNQRKPACSNKDIKTNILNKEKYTVKYLIQNNCRVYTVLNKKYNKLFALLSKTTHSTTCKLGSAFYKQYHTHQGANLLFS